MTQPPRHATAPIPDPGMGAPEAAGRRLDPAAPRLGMAGGGPLRLGRRGRMTREGARARVA